MNKTLQISTYFHCRKCLQELPEGTSPRDYARIGVGFTSDGDVQVWCNRHNENIVMLGERKNEEVH